MFDFLAEPLGWLMWLVYEYIGFHNYFLTIFIFTFLVRLLIFPLSIKNQKSTCDRARLAPRLERLQKKYANDRQKMAQKQQELYEKEGVSMTGGCLPMVVQMVVLFGIIAVIYNPLTNLVKMDAAVVDAAVAGVQMEVVDGAEVPEEGKLSSAELQGYYREMRMLGKLEENKEDIIAKIEALENYDRAGAEAQYEKLLEVRGDFTFGSYSLLENPWRNGFEDISLLWIIPILSGATAMFSSFLSMKYTKKSNPQTMQQGQGCTNGMMYFMPLFSLFITFGVPGGVGVYWICSNLIAVLQTFVLNKMYDPAKARAQGEREFEERRRRKAEDKKRLAEARAREEEEARREAAAEAETVAPKKKSTKKAKTVKQDGDEPLPETTSSDEE